MARKYLIDHDTFASIDTQQKAYCLGFLLADGWITTGNKGVALAVKACDAPVVDYIRDCCKSAVPIITKTRSTGYATGKSLIGTYINSKKLCADLASLGVNKNKTVNGFVPDLRHDLTRHFLRGLFDGDGWIGPRQFMLVGSAPVLSSVARIGLAINHVLYIGMTNNYPRLVGGRRNAAFLRWLYDDCEFALSRKLDTYERYWKSPGARGSNILSSGPSR